MAFSGISTYPRPPEGYYNDHNEGMLNIVSEWNKRCGFSLVAVY